MRCLKTFFSPTLYERLSSGRTIHCCHPYRWCWCGHRAALCPPGRCARRRWLCAGSDPPACLLGTLGSSPAIKTRSIDEQMPRHHSLAPLRIQILGVISGVAICSVMEGPPTPTQTLHTLSPSVCLRTPSGCGWAPGCGCCYSGGTQPAPRCARGPPPHGCWRRTPGTGRTPPASQGSAAKIGSPCHWWWSADQCLHRREKKGGKNHTESRSVSTEPKAHILIRARRRSPKSHTRHGLLYLTLLPPACVISPHGHLVWGKVTVKIFVCGCVCTHM